MQIKFVINPMQRIERQFRVLAYFLRALQKSVVFIFYGCMFFLFASFIGFSYRQVALPNDVTAYVLEVDPQKYSIFPAHAYGQAIGRQTVQDIAEEHQALAAINGGFFKSKPIDGLPAGILKINHQWFGWPGKARGAIGWSQDGSIVLFDRLLCQGSCLIANQVIAIQGINRQPQKSEAIAFTPAFHSTTLTSSEGFEVVIRQNRVLFVREGGNSYIPSDGYILSFGSKQQLPFWKTIQRDTPIYLDIHIIPQLSPQKTADWNRLSHIVGGTPLLVHGGEVITDFSPEKTLTSFLERPHVRSAIGILRNRHWVFVVVEGKQGLLDRGITIANLARFMAYLGCDEALNLDGGGSSTLVIQGKVVNHPSGDEDEGLGYRTVRAVSDAILIKERAKAPQ
jgi:uncharacterized protein YigE (DUF2233 family)